MENNKVIPVDNVKNAGDNNNVVVKRSGTFAKAQQHKKKIAATTTICITIVVVVLVITLGAAVIIGSTSSGGKSSDPELDPEAAKAFQFGTQSVIPPRETTTRRRQLEKMDNLPLGKVLRGLKESEKLIMSGRKLSIDPTKFPPTSEYATTKTSKYVTEESADAMNMINMILCDIMQLRADYMVDKGPYKTLVDESLCTSDGSKMEWTIDVKTVSTGWQIKIWFPSGGNIITVLTDVTKPPTDNIDPGISLYFQMSGDGVTQKGMLKKIADANSMKLQFGQWINGEMDVGGGNKVKFDNQMIGGLSAEYDPKTNVGKASSSSLNFGNGQTVTFKLSFNKDFVLKFSSATNTESCLDLRTPAEVGARYQLYDSQGKGYVFQEGFPVESKDGKDEAWVGYHGLHIQGRYEDGKFSQGNPQSFANGATVKKIEYGGEEGKLYKLKVDNGRLYKEERHTIKLKDLKGVKMETGPWNKKIVIVFDGTSLKKVGEKKEACFNTQTRATVNGVTNYHACFCYGRTTGQVFQNTGQMPTYYWADSIEAQSASSYVVDPEEVKHGMDIQVGSGASQFFGNVKLEFTKRVFLHWVANTKFVAGQAVTQGSATGTVAVSSSKKFTKLNCPNYNCITQTSSWTNYGQTCDSVTKTANTQQSAWYPRGLTVTQANTGAVGMVDQDSYGDQLSFTTISGAFTANGGNLILSTPTNPTVNKQMFGHMNFSGTVELTAQTIIEEKSRNLVVDVTSGTFVDRFAAGAADVMVNNVNVGKPWHLRYVTGGLKKQPDQDTEIAYTTRKLVMPDETVPNLMCYDRCPATSNFETCNGDSNCYAAEPSILSDLNVAYGGNNCVQSGTPALNVQKNGQNVAGVVINAIKIDTENKVLAAATLADTGTHTCSGDYTVQITGLTCTNNPKVEISCNKGTDYATGPQKFQKATQYTYDGVLKSGGNKLEKVYKAGGSNHAVHSGILFEDTPENRKLATCEFSEDQVCYHDLRRKLNVFYTYETGSSHSRRVSLVDDAGKAVKFDQPVAVKYTHTGTTSNSGNNYNGATMILTYEGEGNLYGLPDYCMDKITGKTVDCSPFTENTPDITIPKTAILEAQNGKEYVAKAGEIKQIMKITTASDCSAVSFGTVPVLPKLENFKTFDNGKIPVVKGPLLAVAGVLTKDLKKKVNE